MKILYLHGLGAQPGGTKPTFLCECGHEVDNPALPDDDFDQSVRIAQQALEENHPDVVVASSRGGAVAVNMDLAHVPAVLVAPAWKKWGTATAVGWATLVLHSPHDDVVPMEDSRELLRNSGLADDRLISVGDNHLMVDEAAFAALKESVTSATEGLLADPPPVKLAPPGAGLPKLEAVFLRCVLLPVYCRLTSWTRALKAFEKQGKRLVELAESLPAERFRQRVLVKRPVSLEDCSRYWSADMVLEHLIEVGSRVAVGIVELTHDQTPSVRADIVEVKPRGQRGHQALADYKVFLDDYTRTLSSEVGDRRSKGTLPHPWFGELTAHQWACLGTLHQGAHLRQMERIAAAIRQTT
jgi:hypothetical protein